jgi:hypothetical protein
MECTAFNRRKHLRMKLLPTSAALALALLASGCASIATMNIRNADRLSAPETRYPGHATLYVFRSTSQASALWSFPVSLDGARAGSVRREQYLAIPAKPGTHWLSVTCPGICGLPGFKVNFQVSAGKSYYFVVDPGSSYDYRYSVITTEIRQIDKQYGDRLMETYEAVALDAP